MKFLLDSSVASLVSDELVKLAHEVSSVRDWGIDPGDKTILDKAFSEKSILITLDKDFGELAVNQNLPHCGILRLVNANRHRQLVLCLQSITQYGKDLETGAIVTAEPGRIRIRP